MVDLRYTSLPDWVRQGKGSEQAPDLRGRSYVLVGVGERAERAVHTWAEALIENPVEIIAAATADEAVMRLEPVLAAAHVGVRLWVAGPAGAGLVVRAAAIRMGLSDTEMAFVTFGRGRNTVYCAHCRTVVETDAGVDEQVECSGCGETLLVYYHVSRRTGHYLGFKVDAESSLSSGEHSFAPTEKPAAGAGVAR